MSALEASDPARIATVRDALVAWMKAHKIEYYELNRAMCRLANEAYAVTAARKPKEEA